MFGNMYENDIEMFRKKISYQKDNRVISIQEYKKFQKVINKHKSFCFFAIIVSIKKCARQVTLIG